MLKSYNDTVNSTLISDTLYEFFVENVLKLKDYIGD